MSLDRKKIRRVIKTWLDSHGGKAPKDQGQFTESMLMLFKSLEPHGIDRNEFENGITKRDIIGECINIQWAKDHGKDWKKWHKSASDRFERACISLWPEDIVTQLDEKDLPALKRAIILTEALPEQKYYKKNKLSIEESKNYKPIDRSELEPTGIELISDEEWEKDFLGESK